jgi:phosphatidylserine/phosphatidylglycerophosphate/cardiolipin synthase-like enzyme
MAMIWFKKDKPEEILNSSLHDETTFYKAFFKDLALCQSEVIIESPYLTTIRANQFTPVFQNLIKRGVKIYIITRPPDEHDENLAVQAEGNIAEYEIMGINVSLCSGNHHRKLAILDRKILWEGSLNILSQTYSREIMRRIESKLLTENMFNFLNLGKFL